MTAALDDRLGALLGDTELALRTWLPEQPWAGHRVDRVRLRVLGRFTDQLAWGGPAGLLTVAEARTGGEVVRYGLPLGLRAPRTPLPGVVPITSTGELAVYDAVADDLLTAELTALIGTGAARDRVRFVPRQRAGLALVPRRGLTGRPAAAERG
ncbi:maltokinase N-terminal cap-like domain-containing protein, partial [Amycolatopsis sp. NPDC003861]